MSTTDPIVEFVQDVVDAMGLDLTPAVEEETDGIRINLSGDDGSVLTRRQGEALQALQQIVGAAFRADRSDERRLVVDCNGYRRDKDTELHQMAIFLAGKAKDTGLAQEMDHSIVIRAADRAHGGGGHSVGGHREHRRHVREDRHHLDHDEARKSAREA